MKKVYIYCEKITQKYRIRLEDSQPYPESYLTLDSAKFMARTIFPNHPRLVLK